MRKSLLTVTLLVALAGVCLAQSPPAPSNPFIGGQAYASAFGNWSVGGTALGNAGGTGAITLDVAYVTITGGQQIEPFFVGARLTINDGAATETVTVTSSNCVIGNNAPCTVGAVFTNNHNGRVRITSGTDGLMEAINAMSTSGGAVVVTPDWTGTTAMITGATNGSAKVEVVDQRQGQTSWYGWNGSAYQSAFNINNPPPGLSNITLNGTTTNSGTISGGAVNPTTASIGALTATSPAITPTSIEGVLYADQFSGPDIATRVNEAAAACGSCLVVIPPGSWSVLASSTVAHGIMLRIEAGASIAISSGATWTVPVPVTVGREAVFAGAGTVSFAGNPFVSEVLPEWWGASANGTTDSTQAIVSAISAAESNGSCLSLSAGTYRSSAMLTLPPCVKGVANATTIKYTGMANVQAVVQSAPANNYLAQWSNLTVDGGGYAADGFLLRGTIDGSFFHLRATNVTTSGIECAFCQSSLFVVPVVSHNVAPFATVPVNGIAFDGGSVSANNTVIDMVFEGVSGAGVLLSAGNGNLFINGTSEGNAYGVLCEGNATDQCNGNVFQAGDFEANASADVTISNPGLTGTPPAYNTLDEISATSATAIVDGGLGTVISGGLATNVSEGAYARVTNLSIFSGGSCPSIGYQAESTGVQIDGVAAYCPQQRQAQAVFPSVVYFGNAQQANVAATGVASFPSVENACSGVSAAMVSGEVTINNACITGARPIMLVEATKGGTQGFLSYTQSAGSIVVTSSSSTDTSTVSWVQN